jgi:hypothetical protein
MTSYYKKHLTIACVLSIIVFFIAKLITPVVMNTILPPGVHIMVIKAGEAFTKVVGSWFCFGLFVVLLYMLNVWQKKQDEFKLHLLLSILLSTASMLSVIAYFRISLINYKKIMIVLSKADPSSTQNVFCPNLPWIPLAGIIFVLSYFCLRFVFLRIEKKQCI